MTNVDELKMAVLQTGRSIDETRAVHGDYDGMCKTLLGRAPDEAETFAVLDGEFPDDITRYDVAVITGSKHSAYGDHPWIAPLEELIRTAYRDETKLIGICFGHQIIAQALGGTVEKSDRGFTVGVVDYELIDDDGVRREVPLYAWHQDQIVEAPPGAAVIATSKDCPLAGLRYGDRALSFQAHPEFTKEYMRDLAEARKGGVISDEMGEAAIASLQKEVDTSLVKKMMTTFLSE